MEASAPSIAVNQLSGDVYIAWHAKQGAGDTNVYFAASLDNGATFGAVKRLDDDPMGQNQANVSLAVNERSQKIYATWEDRRGGANVYFTWSEDWGRRQRAGRPQPDPRGADHRQAHEYGERLLRRLQRCRHGKHHGQQRVIAAQSLHRGQRRRAELERSTGRQHRHSMSGPRVTDR